VPLSEVSGSEFIMIMKIMDPESISGNAVIKSKITDVVRKG